MKDKLRNLFDARTTWAVLGTFAGTMFGENVAAAVNAFGVFVMAVI
jgi:hypothetical protein